MDYFICIDSGGSKTDTILIDNTGLVHRRDISKGANGLDIGTDEAIVRIHGAIERVRAGFGEEITAIHGGIAGICHLGEYLYDYLAPKKLARSIRIYDDGPNLVSSMLGNEDGCGMIAGTGATLYIRIADKQPTHIGGKGYLIDTGGSGFVLGREALRMIFREYDGRGEPTILTELVTKELGDHPASRIKEIYSGGRPFIASLAHNVFEGRRTGDRICEQIYDAAVDNLAELTIAAERHFEGDFKVVMGGGLFSAFPEYSVSVRERSSPRAIMILADVPPVYGAAVEAMLNAGYDMPDDDFKLRFSKSYSALAQKR